MLKSDRLLESPLDIRQALKSHMAGAPKAWVFTSATLGEDESLSWFTSATGLEHAQTLRVESPFDYAQHCRLWIPPDFAATTDVQHPVQVAELAARCARAAGGRTFVLTTTLRAVRTIGAQLQSAFQHAGDPLTVLQQGDMPKRHLVAQFLKNPACVLVGSQSFWEGVDIPGSSLQCVVIDKLPFPPPHDPWVEARVRRLKEQGRNAFLEFFVAQAAVSLKQGAGRLIRSESDRGLLVVCDPRMVHMKYGRRLQAALPPMTLVHSEAAALEWLSSLHQHQSV